MCLQLKLRKKGAHMRQAVDSSELSKEFMELTSVNRDYVLAIARALTFAQKADSAPSSMSDYKQQKEISVPTDHNI